MAAGDLTASTPTLCDGIAAIKTHIDTLNLAATTDVIVIVPKVGRDNADKYVVFKVERAAA